MTDLDTKLVVQLMNRLSTMPKYKDNTYIDEPHGATIAFKLSELRNSLVRVLPTIEGLFTKSLTDEEIEDTLQDIDAECSLIIYRIQSTPRFYVDQEAYDDIVENIAWLNNKR